MAAARTSEGMEKLLEGPWPATVITVMSLCLWAVISRMGRSSSKCSDQVEKRLDEIGRQVEELHRWHAPVIEGNVERFLWKLPAEFQRTLEGVHEELKRLRDDVAELKRAAQKG